MPPVTRLRLATGLSLPIEAVTETFAFIGNRGSGKSSALTTFVEQLHAAGQPVVIVDVKGDYWGIRSSRDGKAAGLPFVIFGGEHGDVPLEPTAGQLVSDVVVDERISAVIDLSLLSKTKARSFAAAFFERLYQRNRQPLMLVVEEADVLIPQRADAETARLIGSIEDIAKRGRHRGLGLAIATQRGQEVAKSVLDLIETVVLLRITGRLTIKAINEWISVNAHNDETHAATVIGSLPALEVGEAWVWSPAFLRTVQRVRISRFTTFDSHATPVPGRRMTAPRGRADIDLDKLGAEIAATVERAQESDPRRLRARLVELEQQLRQARDLAEARDLDVERLRSQVRELTAREPEVVTVEAPLDPAVLSSVDAVTARLGEAAELVLGLRTALSNGRRAQAPATQPRRAAPAASRPVAPATRDAAPAPRTPTPGPQPVSSAGRQLPRAQRAILAALVPYFPRSRSKRQVALLTGYASKGGGFNNALSSLRTAGHVLGTRDAITATEQGIAVLGDYAPLPRGDELIRYWVSQLPKASALALEQLVAAWPASLSKAELAARTGYEPTGGGFNNALSRLRTLELITGSVDLRAADELCDQA